MSVNKGFLLVILSSGWFFYVSIYSDTKIYLSASYFVYEEDKRSNMYHKGEGSEKDQY